MKMVLLKYLKIAKNLAIHTDLKIVFVTYHQNNYIGCSNCLLECQNFLQLCSSCFLRF